MVFFLAHIAMAAHFIIKRSRVNYSPNFAFLSVGHSVIRVHWLLFSNEHYVDSSNYNSKIVNRVLVFFSVDSQKYVSLIVYYIVLLKNYATYYNSKIVNCVLVSSFWFSEIHYFDIVYYIVLLKSYDTNYNSSIVNYILYIRVWSLSHIILQSRLISFIQDVLKRYSFESFWLWNIYTYTNALCFFNVLDVKSKSTFQNINGN